MSVVRAYFVYSHSTLIINLNRKHMERKRVKVVMLPSTNHNRCIIKFKHHLEYSNDNFFTSQYLKSIDGEPHHLYLISDDKLEEHDFYYYENGDLKGIGQVKNGFIPKTIILKKVIATSDFLGKKLEDSNITYLPHPSKRFMEKYCKIGRIDEVEVSITKDIMTHIDPNNGNKYGFPKVFSGRPVNHDEVMAFISSNGYPMDKFTHYQATEFEVEYLKTDKHNTITIYPLKNSWTKEELISKVVEGMRAMNSYIIKTSPMKGQDAKHFAQNWIENNLKNINEDA